jgi:hypothetical protein
VKRKPKRKTLTLKIVREEASDSSDEGSSENEELALFAKKFSKFLRTKKGNSRSKPSKFFEKSKGNSNGASQEKRDKTKKGQEFSRHSMS